MKQIGVWKPAAVFAGFVGTVTSATMLTIAWLHNPQYESHSPESIEWGFLIGIGATWFAVAFLAAFVLGALTIRLINLMASGGKD